MRDLVRMSNVGLHSQRNVSTCPGEHCKVYKRQEYMIKQGEEEERATPINTGTHGHYISPKLSKSFLCIQVVFHSPKLVCQRLPCHILGLVLL